MTFETFTPDVNNSYNDEFASKEATASSNVVARNNREEWIQTTEASTVDHTSPTSIYKESIAATYNGEMYQSTTDTTTTLENNWIKNILSTKLDDIYMTRVLELSTILNDAEADPQNNTSIAVTSLDNSKMHETTTYELSTAIKLISEQKSIVSKDDTNIELTTDMPTIRGSSDDRTIDNFESTKVSRLQPVTELTPSITMIESKIVESSIIAKITHTTEDSLAHETYKTEVATPTVMNFITLAINNNQ